MATCKVKKLNHYLHKVERIVTPTKCSPRPTGSPINPPTGGHDVCLTSCDVYLFIWNYTLTKSDIAAGYIMLPFPADPLYKDQCMLYVEDGPVLLPPMSYEIVDKPISDIFNRLEWINRDIHGIIEEGEHIRLNYVRKIV